MIRQRRTSTRIDVRPQQGFTLIELAVSMAIIGIAFSGFLLTTSQYIRAEKVKQTRQDIAMVQNVLSVYVQQHYRLPCPADPQAANGTEIDGGNCFKNSSNADLYWETEGVLPWKELGIPQSMAMDAWQHYITYKPAPHLTVDNLSTEMQNKNNDPVAAPSDTHNACRTAMWYDSNSNHLNRAKALFCCNAAPKNSYIANATYGVPGALSSDWMRTGIVDTNTAKTANIAGTSLPTATPVAMTTNWMDSHTVASVHGAFQGFNSSKPEPPLLRATGLAVTLISHGGDGDLAFIPQQVKTALMGGGTVNVGTGVTSADPNVEKYNVWPPHIFSGVFGHAKVNDGSYNPISPGAATSDDIVSYLRSDDLFGLVGQASCQRPPGAVFQPEPPCTPQKMKMQENEFSPTSGGKIKMNSISVTLQQTQGVPYILKSVAQRLTDDAGFNNSLGVYTIAKDGTIKSVAMLATNMHSLQVGQSASANASVPEDGSSVGTFLLANGDNVNFNYFNATIDKVDSKGNVVYDTSGAPVQVPNPNAKLVDLDKMQMVYHFGKSDMRAANIADGSNVSLVAPLKSTGALVQLNGANSDSGSYSASTSADTGIHNMYSQMNYNQIAYGWRVGCGNSSLCPPDEVTKNNVIVGTNNSDVAKKTVLPYAGVDSSDDTKMKVGFEDLSSVKCYYAVGNPDTCDTNHPNTKPPYPKDPTKPQKGEARLDQYGGYMTRIGDNDYDDVATTMAMTACPLQD